MFNYLDCYFRPKYASKFWTFSFTSTYSPRISVKIYSAEKVQLAEDNYLWHEPEEANIIDTAQSTNLIIVFSIELSFKLIISWIWGMMSWCLITYIFYIYKLKAVSTEFSHVKFWVDNLVGFCIQIIHNSIGEKGPMGYWNWTIAQDYLNSSFR